MIDKSGYQFHKLATSCLVKKIGLLGLLHMEPQFCESVFLKRSLVFIEKSLTIRSHILHNCNLWGFFLENTISWTIQLACADIKTSLL